VDVELVTVKLGGPRYEELLGPVRSSPLVLARMWADAESRLDERAGKLWCVATVRYGGRWVAAAWAAAYVDGDTLRCCNNYERPGWRGRDLYRLAYDRRHTTVVDPSSLAGLTYVFAQPKRRHERDGWRVTASDVSREPGIHRTAGSRCAGPQPNVPPDRKVL